MRSRARANERGASAVLAAFLIVVIGAFAALVVNVGHIMGARAQLQNAVDAAALAGAMSLDGTAEGLVEAHNDAKSFGDRYHVYINDVSLTPNVSNGPGGDIVVGHWDLLEPNRAAAFTPYDGTMPLAEVNAVLARTGRESARGNPLTVFLSGFLNDTSASVGAQAVAVGGGPCESCAVPIAFADCMIKRPDGSLNCGAELRFANALEDNVGFTNLTPGQTAVGTSDIINILTAGCGEAGYGDVVGVSNGNNLTPNVIDAFEAYIAAHGPKVTAPVIDVEDSDCANPQFNQPHMISGFATFTITSITGPPDEPERSIHIRLECDETSSDTSALSGCVNYGTSAPVTRLVY